MMRLRQARLRTLLALALTTATLLMLPGPSRASTSTKIGSLPQPLSYAGSASSGGSTYLFGGWTGNTQTDQIVRYDHVSRTAQTMRAHLPLPWEGVTSVFASGYYYLFGGSAGTSVSHSDQVLRYDPQTDSMTTLSARLPVPLSHSSAIFDGRYIFLFGGEGNDNFTTDRCVDAIWRFDPSTGIFTTMSSRLAHRASRSSVVWSGSAAYILGGDKSGTVYDTIQRYDPATDRIDLLSEKLPWANGAMATAWDGQRAFLYGGTTGGSLVVYDPAAHRARGLSVSAPNYPLGAAAVWDGSGLVIFGGEDGYAWPIAAIGRYTGEPDAVANMAAAVSPDATVTVTWDPPPEYSSASAVSGYDVYRSVDGGPRTFAANAPVPSFSEPMVPGATRYDYTVVAKSSLGDGPGTTLTLTEPGPVPGLTAVTGPQRGQIKLDWSPSANGGDTNRGYRIYSVSDGGALTALATLPGSQLSFIDSGLPDGATRRYRLSSVNGIGESTLTATVSATTTPPLGPPSTPLAVTTVAGPGVGQITVQWAAPQTDGGRAITSYRIYYVADAGNDVLAGSVGSTSRYFVASGLGPGQTRSYRVSAVNDIGESPRTNPAVPGAAPQAPSPPVSLRAGLTVLARVYLDWKQPVSNGGMGLTEYKVYRGFTSGSGTLLDRTTTPSYVDNTCPLGSVCYYTVTAVNPVGESPPSNEVSQFGTAFLF